MLKIATRRSGLALLIFTPLADLEWISLDADKAQTRRIERPTLALALGSLTLSWRGVHRTLYRGDLHATRAGEIFVARAASAPSGLVALGIRASTSDVARSSSCNSLEATIGPRGAAMLLAFRHALETVATTDVEALADEQPQLIEPGPVRRARIHIEACYADAPSLDELAEVANVSRFHLAHAFRAHHFVGPHAYLNAVRISHARELLESGVPAAVVASRVGFVDQSHLTRRFREAVGLTPSVYAAAPHCAAS